MIHLEVRSKNIIDSSQLTIWERLRLLLRMQRYALPYWDKILFRFLASLVTSATAVVPALLTARLIDVAFPSGDYVLVAKIAALALAVIVTGLILAFTSIVMSAYKQSRITLDLEAQFYRHVQKLSMRFFAGRPVGEHMARTLDCGEAAYLASEVIPAVFAIMQRVALLVFVISVKFEAWLLIPAFAYLIILFSVKHALTTRIRLWDRRFRVETQRLEAVLREILFPFKLIKAYARQRTARRWYGWQACRAVLANFLNGLYIQYDLHVTFALMPLYVAALAFIIGPLVLAEHLTLGEYTAICLPGVGLMWQFVAPFQEAIITFQTIRQRLIPGERMLETLGIEPEIVDAPNAQALKRAQGGLEVRNVSFSYIEGIPALRNVSLEARPGEKIALVGPTGAGKSTLCALLVRLYDPQEGEMLIDGAPYRSVTQESLRRQMAIVTQAIDTFTESIERNIRYGEPTATDDAVLRAARIACVDEFASRTRNGYATVLSEGGSISGGQKQRLCIARALVRDAPILILDEATSALDPVTEKEVVENIDKAYAGRTRIVVAHNLLNARDADRIYVLDEGCVVQVGTHDELITGEGLYATLWGSGQQPTG